MANRKPDLPEDVDRSIAEHEPRADLSWVDDFPARKYGLPMLRDKGFAEIFTESAMLFMDAKQIARMLGLTDKELDDRCQAVFGEPKARAVVEQLRSAADQDARNLMRMLAENGNSTATGIYANYIARLSHEEDAQRGGIHVTVNIPKED